MNSDIKELTLKFRELVTQMKKVEADIAMVKNVNKKLVNQLIKTEQQCWANPQYSRHECLEVVGIPTSIPNNSLETIIQGFLINLECMSRGKTFRHVIV